MIPYVDGLPWSRSEIRQRRSAMCRARIVALVVILSKLSKEIEDRVDRV